METTALSSFLFMGLALGLLHAFDPDHLAAVGGLSATEKVSESNLGPFRFGVHWSLGHGAALLLVSIAVFFVGKAIPVHLSEVAERCVAFVLIAIGLLAFRRLLMGDKKDDPDNGYKLGAPFVGLLHGTAGSAPLLALIPIAQLSQPINGVIYVLFFSMGVILAMTALSGIFAHSMRMASRCNWPLHALFQGLMASFSLFLGLFLAFSNV